MSVLGQPAEVKICALGGGVVVVVVVVEVEVVVEVAWAVVE